MAEISGGGSGSSQSVAANISRPYGLYIPLFRTLAGFDNSGTGNTNLSLHPSGGVYSATPGSVAEGWLRLPAMADPEKPSRVDVVFQYTRNASYNNQLVVEYGDYFNNQLIVTCGVLVTAITAANPCVITTQYNHGLTTGETVTIVGGTGNTGINGTWTVTRISGNQFSIPFNNAAGSTTTANALVDIAVNTIGSGNNSNGIIPDGALVCLSVSTGGGSMTQSIQVVGSTGPQSYGVNNNYRAPLYRVFASSTVAFGHTVASKLDRLHLQSYGMRILGAFVNLAGWDGPPDNLLPTRTVIGNCTADNLSVICLPERGLVTTAQDIVVAHHQNLGNEGSPITAGSGWANGTTARKLLDAGFALVSSNGAATQPGSNTNTPDCQQAYNFGSGYGLAKTKAVLDALRANVTNPAAKVFHLGGSMGGVNALQFAQRFPGTTKAIALVCGVTDLAEAGLLGAPASLLNPINYAYSGYYVSITAGNVGNALGDTANWRPLAPGGAEPFYADRIPAITTVSAGASNATQALTSAAAVQPGMRLWFGILREARTVLSISGNNVVLDQSISTTTAEPVSIYAYPGGNYGGGLSTQWQNRAAYNAGTTYAIGDIVFAADNGSGTTLGTNGRSNNPAGHPECYVGIPILSRYGNSGTTNDGTINVVQGNTAAGTFGALLNALSGGNFTPYLVSGASHLASNTFEDGATGLNDITTFFLSNK